MKELLRSNIQGEPSIWGNERQQCAYCSAPCVCPYVTKFTYQLRLVATCLSAYSFDIIASLFAYHFPQRKRLLLCSQFIPVAWLERGIHSRCYQALAVNLGIWELFLCFKSPNVVFLLIWRKGQNREVSSLSSLNRWAERDRRFQRHCLLQIWRETAAGVQ